MEREKKKEPAWPGHIASGLQHRLTAVTTQGPASRKLAVQLHSARSAGIYTRQRSLREPAAFIASYFSNDRAFSSKRGAERSIVQVGKVW